MVRTHDVVRVLAGEDGLNLLRLGDAVARLVAAERVDDDEGRSCCLLQMVMFVVAMATGPEPTPRLSSSATIWAVAMLSVVAYSTE